MSSWSIVFRTHRTASRIATLLAILGAVVLLGAATLVCISVVSRIVTGVQIRGDFEAMAVSSGIAILLFLPYCQASRSHVFVEVFTAWLPDRGLRLLEALWSLLLAAAAAVLTWRLAVGLEEAWSRGDVTLMLSIPLHVVFAAAVIGAAGTAFLALLDFLKVFSGSANATENDR